MCNADFSDAKLNDVDLRGAKMVSTDFTRAILVCADLMSANLEDAVLVGANLDYACWPLWSYSLHAKIDKRLFCQFLYHIAQLGQSADDDEIRNFLSDPKTVKLINESHLTKFGKR